MRASIRTRSRILQATTIVVLGLLLAACAAPGIGTSDGGSTPPVAAPASPLAAGGLQDPRATASGRADVPPAGIRIPRIGVDSRLESLAVDSDGRLIAPRDYDRAGWYAGGVVPGAVGPAIIAGHVDSPTAPAVFARLGELRAGDEIVITRRDGVALNFRVTRSTQSAKSAFPTDAVYSNVPAPELRLITCAGAFDTAAGHYTDNLIVFAALDG